LDLYRPVSETTKGVTLLFVIFSDIGTWIITWIEIMRLWNELEHDDQIIKQWFIVRLFWAIFAFFSLTIINNAIYMFVKFSVKDHEEFNKYKWGMEVAGIVIFSLGMFFMMWLYNPRENLIFICRIVQLNAPREMELPEIQGPKQDDPEILDD